MEKVKDFDKDVVEASDSDIVLVQFTAEWCGPCKAIKPQVAALEKERGDFKYLLLDVDEHNDVARKFNIRAIPTLILFKDKQPHVFEGMRSMPKISEFIDSFKSEEKNV